jgi:trypsin
VTALPSFRMMSSRRRAVAGLAICAIALSAAAVASPAIGKRSPGARAHTSVVGGSVANPAEWPFVVAIYRKNRLHCGGSVIAPTKVLTAAHCVEGFNLSNFAVIANRPDLKNVAAGQSTAIAAGATHPDFATTGTHDMAVLTLVDALPAPPVALASAAENALFTVQGAQLSMAGWGAQNPLGFRLSTLLKTTVEKVRATRRCLRAYTRDIFNPEAMICALGRKIPKYKRPPIHTSACTGDSGGPLIASTSAGPRQVGIVSYGGAFCGLPAAPTVYSRVSAGLDFIDVND